MHEKEIIEKCKNEFIKKYKFTSDELQQRDFEFLHEKIFEITQVNISTTTLRRFWSNNYQSSPQTNTLNALAQCIGFASWHDFAIHCGSSEINKYSKFKKVALWVLIIAICGWLLYYILPLYSSHEVYLKAEVSIYDGVPATIGFNYNVAELSKEALIQLSWNPNERASLDPQKSFYTGTYFYPDYHEAKIIYEDKIIATDFVHITTEGWNGLIMQEGYDINPTYIENTDFVKENSMTVNDTTALKKNLNILEYFPVFTLSNTELDTISGDSFSMSCNLKLLASQITRNCRSIDILVKGETGNIRIPISEVGCYGLYQLSVSEKNISGKTTDLSRLTTNLSVITPISLVTKDHELKIKVGDKDEFRISYKNSLGPVKVIKFVLTGAGEVSNFQLSRDTPLIF